MSVSVGPLRSVLCPQRMLDLEYEECLKATKSRNIEDYDQGPTGDEWDKEIVPDPEAVRAAGYEPFGSDETRRAEAQHAHANKTTGCNRRSPCVSPCVFFSGRLFLSVSSGSPSGVLPNDYDGADPRLDVTLEEDEWSEAWAEYKKECAEEEEDARNKGITDDDVKNQTAPDEPALAPKPLSQGQLQHRSARCLLGSVFCQPIISVPDCNRSLLSSSPSSQLPCRPSRA